MKILLLPAYFHPETVASGYLTENRDEAFTSAGFDLVTRVPTPCRGISKEVRKLYCEKKYRHESLYGGKMQVYRFPLYTEGKNPVLRALRYSVNWVIQLWYGLTEKNVDCIFLASTPPIQGMIGALMKKYRNIPFVYNLQDIFPDSLVNTGLAKKDGLLWKIGRIIENFTYKYADKIIVISEDFKDNIIAKGVPEDKIEVVYNWVDQDAVVDIPRDKNKLFDKYGLDRSKFYVSYSGNIGMSQNMDMLLNVAKDFQTSYSDIQFVLIGEGAYKSEVEKIVAEKALKNVHILPYQPYEDISHVFSLGDAGLVISKPGTGAASVPSKTWSIMSASRPVLANFDENELKTIIQNNNCGIFSKAGDIENFKYSILKLYNDRNLCNILGRNGRQFIMNNLTKQVGTKKYIDIVNSVLKK
jgi:glycosyltransferase involved in cell wall biosynthesis